MHDHSPFRLTKKELIQSGINNTRFKHTLSFIGDHTSKLALDIGERNPLTPLLEEKLKINIQNTNIDLDVENLSGQYDTIFCFEIIEHLMNPLHLLIEIRNCLKGNGICYISTPICKPHFLWDPHHFTEYDHHRLNALVNRAGFEIIRYKVVRSRPLFWYLGGIRPLIRFFVNKTILIELRKKAP